MDFPSGKSGQRERFREHFPEKIQRWGLYTLKFFAPAARARLTPSTLPVLIWRQVNHPPDERPDPKDLSGWETFVYCDSNGHGVDVPSLLTPALPAQQQLTDRIVVLSVHGAKASPGAKATL